jgi:hypothetical protein
MNSSILVITTFSSLEKTYLSSSSLSEFYSTLILAIASIANATPLAFIEGALILTLSITAKLAFLTKSMFSAN